MRKSSALTLIILATIGFSTASLAETLPIWTSGLQYSVEKSNRDISLQPIGCKEESVNIDLSGIIEVKTGCVISGRKASMTTYRDNGGYSRFALKLTTDGSYIPINGRSEPLSPVVYLPGSDILLTENNGYRSPDYAMLESYGDVLEAVTYDSQGHVYNLNEARKFQLLTFIQDGVKRQSYDITYATSPNGR